MELIKELGSRTTVSSSGKSSTRKWGLFECPSCKIQNEYSLQKGRKNKTCGAAGCRKTAANFNPWNADISEADRLKNQPYYSSFTAYYNTLSTKYDLCPKWGTLKGFREDMYDSFKALRDAGASRLTLLMRSHGILDNINCKWTSDMKTEIHAHEDKIHNYYHSLLLTQELLIPSEDLDKLIKETYPSKCKEVIWGSQGNTVASPNMGFKLNIAEYSHIRHAIRLKQQIKNHYTIYAIRMVGTQFVKIGRTTNMKARLDDINIGNPYALEVLFEEPSYNLGKIEQRVHKFLRKYHKKGEWFELDDQKIKEARKFLIDIVDNP